MTKLQQQRNFIALYWGQSVGCTQWQLGFKIGKSNILNVEWLELTPLSDISDEDAIEVAKITGNYFQGADHSNSRHEEIKKYWTENMIAYGLEFISNHSLNRGSYSTATLLKATDFLRSRGFALPYLGISVEQQIEFGWAKLKTK